MGRIWPNSAEWSRNRPKGRGRVLVTRFKRQKSVHILDKKYLQISAQNGEIMLDNRYRKYYIIGDGKGRCKIRKRR
jgi:hypothetical protein